MSRAILAMGILIAGCSGPREVGHDQAERDIASGTLRLKTYGLPAPWFDSYAKLMKDRLGVELVGVAGCDVDEALRENVEGYNLRMEAEIERKFGAGSRERIVKEAERPPGSEWPRFELSERGAIFDRVWRPRLRRVRSSASEAHRPSG